MASQTELLLARADDLISRGEAVQQTKWISTDQFRRATSWVDKAAFSTWMASSLAFLRRVFGVSHTHTQLFQQRCIKNSFSDALEGTAILRSAREEIEQGYLVSLEQLVSADVFTDFLEMAEHLLEKGFHHPAASLERVMNSTVGGCVAYGHGAAVAAPRAGAEAVSE
jgi:hypothetical protein